MGLTKGRLIQKVSLSRGTKVNYIKTVVNTAVKEKSLTGEFLKMRTNLQPIIRIKVLISQWLAF